MNNPYSILQKVHSKADDISSLVSGMKNDTCEILTYLQQSTQFMNQQEQKISSIDIIKRDWIIKNLFFVKHCPNNLIQLYNLIRNSYEDTKKSFDLLINTICSKYQVQWMFLSYDEKYDVTDTAMALLIDLNKGLKSMTSIIATSFDDQDLNPRQKMQMQINKLTKVDRVFPLFNEKVTHDKMNNDNMDQSKTINVNDFNKTNTKETVDENILDHDSSNTDKFKTKSKSESKHSQSQSNDENIDIFSQLTKLDIMKIEIMKFIIDNELYSQFKSDKSLFETSLKKCEKIVAGRSKNKSFQTVLTKWKKMKWNSKQRILKIAFAN